MIEGRRLPGIADLGRTGASVFHRSHSGLRQGSLDGPDPGVKRKTSKMPPRFLLPILVALAFEVLGSAGAHAQQGPTVAPPVKPTMPYKPSAQPPQKQAPGKTCIQYMLNSQAHRECIESQAKAAEAARKAKAKP